MYNMDSISAKHVWQLLLVIVLTKELLILLGLRRRRRPNLRKLVGLGETTRKVY